MEMALQRRSVLAIDADMPTARGIKGAWNRREVDGLAFALCKRIRWNAKAPARKWGRGFLETQVISLGGRPCGGPG